MASNMFKSDTLTYAYLHASLYRCGHDSTCYYCEQVRALIRFGTGFLLRALYDRRDRKLAGSNVVGIDQGELTANQAALILRDVSYVISNNKQREETDFTISMRRMHEALDRDFPGLDVCRDMGRDTPLYYGNYTPLLVHGDELYSTLSFMYKLSSGIIKDDKIPNDLVYDFILLSFNLNAFFDINPNAVWGLWSNSLQTDLIAHLSKL